MTTPQAAALYLCQHQAALAGRPVAVFNPHGKPVESLPVIYGYNNGGPSDMLSAQLISEDGVFLGGHCCSHEGYMLNDLGILEGCRPDRHETFRKHYPDGYRMAFVPYAEAIAHTHKGLEAAYAAYEARKAGGVPCVPMAEEQP